MSEPIGSRLRRWRTKRRLTQVQAATLLDVNVDTYRSWEQDKYVPSESQLGKILKRTSL